MLRLLLSAALAIGKQEGALMALSDSAAAAGCAAVKEPVRFLRPGETRDRVSVVSYPRSGNSLTRSMTQAISGIFSGSDMGGGVPGAARRDNNPRGEKIFDQTVFAIKTHWYPAPPPPLLCSWRF